MNELETSMMLEDIVGDRARAPVRKTARDFQAEDNQRLNGECGCILETEFHLPAGIKTANQFY